MYDLSVLRKWQIMIFQKMFGSNSLQMEGKKLSIHNNDLRMSASDMRVTGTYTMIRLLIILSGDEQSKITLKWVKEAS